QSPPGAILAPGPRTGGPPGFCARIGGSMLHRRRKLWLLAGMSLVLGVAGLALGQEDFSGTYELRPAAAFGLAQKDRVRLHLEKGKSGYELSRTVTHADGSVESWRGTATLTNNMLRCEFPAKR